MDGVPLTAPLAASDRPGGRVPSDTLNVIEASPPAVKVNAYGVPTTPFGGAPDVKATAGSATTMVTAWSEVIVTPETNVARTVKG